MGFKKVAEKKKQRRFETVQLQIGKNGLTDSFVEQVRRISASEERMKITILKSACRDKEEAKTMCDNLVEKLGKNYTYKLIGYVCTLFRFRKDVRA
jgi:RNA-binding protein YhbY